MKKTIVLLICALMCLGFCFVACEKQPSSENTTDSQSAETSSTGTSVTSNTVENVVSISVDGSGNEFSVDDEGNITVLKTYFKEIKEPTLIINAKLNNEEHLHLADKTVEILVGLTKNYDEIFDSTSTNETTREFMRDVFENRNIIAISQIIILEGKEYFVYEDLGFRLVAYVFFDDDEEHKNEIYVDFLKTKNDEFVICGLSLGG